MILTGSEILKCVSTEKIVINPFNRAQLNPNSYNFTLGDELMVYDEYVLDSHKENKMHAISIPDSGITLTPGRIYLANTVEIIGSNYFVPIIRGRSSIGRLGIFTNITSDLINIGEISQIMLQLSTVQPVVIYPRIQIGQVTFWKTFSENSDFSI